jgi:tetratricopeptide (TPR) repeat protein
MTTAEDRIYRAGDRIGGDWLVCRVMEGGLGVVYAVQNREGDLYVLKAPKQQSQRAVQDSFRAEAEAWVRLGDHPNIVRALAVNEFAGQFFVVAELVERDQLGRISLRDHLRSAPLEPGRVAAWMADLCYGLDYAYSKGLIAHRDLKPENLLIGASGVLRITDFGIARAMALSGGGVQSKIGVWDTRDGAVSGTPPYMAPEQWRGILQDARTDIYAAGIVLYEMCYGRPPFAANTVERLAEQHLRLKPDIPEGIFAGVIARCLAKDSATRYSGPAAMLDDIGGVCKPHQIALPPKPRIMGQRAKELIALARGLGAVGKRDEAIGAAHSLVELEPDVSAHWTELSRLLLEDGDDRGGQMAIERSLAIDETRSPAWNNYGVVLKRQQRWQQAAVAFDRALDCDPLNTGAMLSSSEALRHLGRSGEALIRLKRAADIASDKFSVWNNLGAAYIDLGDKQQALRCLRKARSLAPDRYHAGIDQSIEVAGTLPDELSGAALMMVDPAMARQRLQEEIVRNPSDKNAWHNLGLLHIQSGEHGRARDCFSRVLKLDRGDAFAICRLIELSGLSKDVSAVERWCSVLAQMPGGSIAAIAFKARALVQCDRYQDAKGLILEGVRRHPEDADILIACGDVMMVYPRSGTAMSNATEVYRRAVEILEHERGDVTRLREIQARLKQARENLEQCKRDDAV